MHVGTGMGRVKPSCARLCRRRHAVARDISVELLCNIFYDKAPLHDGAIVIDDARIAAAGF